MQIIKSTEVFIMKNNIFEAVFILDKSGSMSGLESDTIGGFNAMLKKQKELDGKCYISTVLFNDKSEVIHDRLDVNNVSPLTENEYSVGGCTALTDAIGVAIHHIENIHKYARPEDVPEHTMFVITTDGLENASREYSADRVRKMVEEKKVQGWEFIFLAANIDSVETAAHYGIGRDRAVNYIHDETGTKHLHKNISSAVCKMRTDGCLEDNWCAEIETDNKIRGKKNKKK